MSGNVFGLNYEQSCGIAWMVICVDGYNRDSKEDWIVCRDCRSEEMAKRIANVLNNDDNDESIWYVAVPSNHRLNRGMEDLI